MGVSPASELFQARMHEALRGLAGVVCIADDILVTGSGDDLQAAQRDHDKNVVALLERCRQLNIKLNKDKFQLNRQEVRFMGHKLTANGLQIDDRKVAAVLQMPPPTGRQAVMRLLGNRDVLSEICAELQ